MTPPPDLPSLDVNDVIAAPSKTLERADLFFKRRETPEETKARLQKEAVLSWFGIVKNSIVILFVTIGVAIILWYCLDIMTSATTSPDDKKWAQTVLGGAVTVGLGYLIGKNT